LITVRKSKMFSSNSSQVSEDANYIESCFSTYLYTGNGSTQTITNGIDLAGKGGLVWIKGRSGTYGAESHNLTDTARGTGYVLFTNATNAQFANSDRVTAFNSNGFSLGSSNQVNGSSTSIASWTFRKQPKFFDVVTYTGNGSSITVNHNLGSVPGMIIIKNLTNADSWLVWHRSLSGTSPRMFLNDTSAAAATLGIESSSVSATSFTYPWSYSTGNAAGNTYVAYIFAHNAGGFGLTGTDNVISCGSFTTDASGNATVSLGYEPQWVLTKSSATSGTNWNINDSMRGLFVGADPNTLFPNLSNAESTSSARIAPTATGFIASGGWVPSSTYIYIAIRRGPMKVPTDGTKVFAPVAYTGNNTDRTVSAPFVTDLAIVKSRDASVSAGATWGDRLRGQAALDSSSTGAEFSAASVFQANPWDVQGGVKIGSGANATNNSGTTYVDWMFRRAPGFFDVVCYTGNGTSQTITHNLTVAPELIIVKRRPSGSWVTYDSFNGAGKYLVLNSTNAVVSDVAPWNNTAPTSSVFSVASGGGFEATNQSGTTIVAYLFASCPGVSKVFNFTGNGSSQTINCGFTGGARFVMIKRTDSTGDWYVWDSARGIVASNDPHLSLNTTAAEVTTDDSVDTDSTGFIVNQNSATNVNVNGATYIGLAVA
jgi:hypothetical protein